MHISTILWWDFILLKGYKAFNNADILVVGLPQVLLRPSGRVDLSTIERAKEMFGDDNVMQNVVKRQKRLKVWDVTGTTDNDQHDKKDT